MKLNFSASALVACFAVLMIPIIANADVAVAPEIAPQAAPQAAESATTPPEWSIEAGLGLNTSTGVLGAKVRRSFSEHGFALAGGGIDFRSAVFSGGAGWQTSPRARTCFFFFDCTKRILFEAAYVYFPEGTKDNARSSSHGECDHWWYCERSTDGSLSSPATYRISSSSALNTSVVWQDLFGKSFFYEFELGYLAMLSESNVTRVSGSGAIGVGRSSSLAAGIKFGRYF